MHILENNCLKISIKNAGAELTSIFSKNNNTEYLWQGNSKFWNRQSPVLFPFVGKLKNDTYFIDGKSYKQSQHGFARNKEFKLVEDVKTKKVFELNWLEETLKVYPYKFTLQILYELKESTLQVSFKVINTDDKDVYFSIGAHPAFSCPLQNTNNFSDYYIEFESEENINQLFLNTENGLIQPEKAQQKRVCKIPLDYSLFENDALIFEKIQSNSVSLKSTKHNNGITLSAKNWDYFAFWTKKDAPFLCFEPWMGIADAENTNQNFKEKIGVKKLGVGEVYCTNYSITIF